MSRGEAVCLQTHSSLAHLFVRMCWDEGPVCVPAWFLSAALGEETLFSVHGNPSSPGGVLGFGFGRPSFESWPYLSKLQAWTNPLPSLSLGFLIWKMGIKIIPALPTFEMES